MPDHSNVKYATRDAARTAESSTVFEALARAGYAANGVIHLLIGVIALVVAFGGDGDSSQSGAFTAIAAAPLGFAVLWALAVTLWALAAWHVLEAILARGDAPSKWGLRASEAGQAVAFLVLGMFAAAVALGARPESTGAFVRASTELLAVPGGVFVLGLVAVAVGAAGVSFVVIGIRRGFRKKMTIPRTPFGAAVTTIGLIGYLAKGIALLIVGVLLLVAAVRVDPREAGGLDAAMSTLLALPFGPWLTGAVGVGLIAYGLFCFLRARYAKL